ncbi:hypothetical protein ACFE04_028884 [Oxalis oulophora]
MEEISRKAVENFEGQTREEVPDDEDSKRTLMPWKSQITIRSLVASVFIGIIYSIVSMKLGLTTGLIPNLNVSAALLGYVFLKTWTTVLQKLGIKTAPFTKQENTMVQTCAVACYAIAFGG